MFNKLFKQKKGMQNLQEIPGVVIALVIAGVVGLVGTYIMTQVGTGFTGAALGVLNNATLTVTNFFALAPTLGTVLVAGLLISAVLGLGFYGYNRFVK